MSEFTNALFSFTKTSPTAAAAVQLGTDDGWMKVSPRRGYNEIVIEGFALPDPNRHTASQKSAHLLSAAERKTIRANVETYMTALIAALGGEHDLLENTLPNGVYVVLPTARGVGGTITNTWTSNVYERCFLTSYDWRDTGTFYAEFTLTFAQFASLDGSAATAAGFNIPARCWSGVEDGATITPTTREDKKRVLYRPHVTGDTEVPALRAAMLNVSTGVKIPVMTLDEIPWAPEGQRLMITKCSIADNVTELKMRTDEDTGILIVEFTTVSSR